VNNTCRHASQLLEVLPFLGKIPPHIDGKTRSYIYWTGKKLPPLRLHDARQYQDTTPSDTLAAALRLLKRCR
jgi:hypothetical protein